MRKGDDVGSVIVESRCSVDVRDFIRPSASEAADVVSQSINGLSLGELRGHHHPPKNRCFVEKQDFYSMLAWRQTREGTSVTPRAKRMRSVGVVTQL